MSESSQIRMAVQKSGRLSEKSFSLLQRCGLNFDLAKDRLFNRCENFPMDLMLLRDDDIPGYVNDGICDLGIVGLNVLQEKLWSQDQTDNNPVEILTKLDFGQCRLSLALPADVHYSGLSNFDGLRIATSYPATLRRFLQKNQVEAEIISISGSVEVAPALRIADAVCDLVSSGGTLRSNGLKEVQTVLESTSVLVKTTRPLSTGQQSDIDRLLQRIKGSQKAAQTKYIMMNAPRTALKAIKDLIPGMEEPSIIPLGDDGKRIAIHSVSHENIFWETMEQLKSAGASSILVLPIEKIIA
jgi:ATP phosphoribosyltransferase